jgi:protease YdgD
MSRSRCAVALAFAATVAMSGFSPTRSQAEERASPMLASRLLFCPASAPTTRVGAWTPTRLRGAVGKLQIAFHQSCTATLVGPATVVTAAHCAFNPRTQRYHLPGSLHFLFGYDGSRYAGHAIGIKIETGPGYDPSRPRETIGSDWVLISLDTPLGSSDRVLPMIGKLPQTGSTIILGGYQQDHPLVLMADTDRRVVGQVTDSAGRLLLWHNCTGTRGVSGAPLLTEKDGNGIPGD